MDPDEKADLEQRWKATTTDFADSTDILLFRIRVIRAIRGQLFRAPGDCGDKRFIQLQTAGTGHSRRRFAAKRHKKAQTESFDFASFAPPRGKNRPDHKQCFRKTSFHRMRLRDHAAYELAMFQSVSAGKR